MTMYQALLITATLLCSLVAGFLFAFAAVVMPGIRSLDDGSFIRAFQVIDRVIQNNQPAFMVVWMGSVLTLVAAAVLGMWVLSGVDRVLVVAGTLVYLLCVQAPTITVNVPLNNEIQRVDAGTIDEAQRKAVRDRFEIRWNRWNVFRTIAACGVTLVLLIVIRRM